MNALKKKVYVASGEHGVAGETRWDDARATKKGTQHVVNPPWSSVKHRVSRANRMRGIPTVKAA